MILQVLCVALYALCLALLWRNVKVVHANAPYKVYLMAAAAIATHAYALHQIMNVQGEIVISIGMIISIAGLISAFLFLLLWLKLRIAELGFIVYPTSMIAAIAGFIQPEHMIPLSQYPDSVQLHILIAIPTYGVLFMAFAQACLLSAQDRNMRKGTGGLMANLPPIQSMESCLFFLIGCGFALMTLNLMLGIFSNQMQTGNILNFNHHIIFSISAWIIFAMTIMGRYALGWRGERAAKMTIVAFTFLVLAYFGTRFVNELILA